MEANALCRASLQGCSAGVRAHLLEAVGQDAADDALRACASVGKNSHAGHAECMRQLVQGGAEPTGALNVAIVSGSPQVVRLLMELKADVRPGHWLATAVCVVDPSIAELLVDVGGADVNAGDERGRTPLMRAVFLGHSDVARVLIARGADVNAADVDGLTVLMEACFLGSPAVVQLLIHNGADVLAKTRTVGGGTALQLAAEYGHDEVVRLLIEAGAGDVEAALRHALAAVRLLRAGGRARGGAGFLDMQ